MATPAPRRASAWTGLLLFALLLPASALPDAQALKLGIFPYFSAERLALPPKLAIVHQLALETLERNGLQPGRDVQILPRKSHDQALYAVLRRKADAAAFGLPTWQHRAAQEKRALMVIGRFGQIPGFALMAHPRLAGETMERLRQALFDFAGQPAGRRYFDATELRGVRPVTARDLALLDHYLERIRAAGGATQP